VGSPLPVDGGDADAVIAGYRQLGIEAAALALQLQREGAGAFQKAWDGLLAGLERKRAQLDETASR
jgi:transaldolase